MFNCSNSVVGVVPSLSEITRLLSDHRVYTEKQRRVFFEKKTPLILGLHGWAGHSEDKLSGPCEVEATSSKWIAQYQKEKSFGGPVTSDRVDYCVAKPFG